MKGLDFRTGAVSLALAALACAGCFDEPESAEKTVRPGQRIYMSGKGLKRFQLADLEHGSVPLAEIDYLNLDRNELTNVDEVAQLTGLKWLRLNGNRLAELPDLSALKSLRRLYLRGNRLERLPESLRELPALTDLDLSGNPIAEVPEWLAQKEGLENLSFNHTGLKRLPDDLSHWRSLKSLQLGGLELSAAEMARIRAAFDPKENPLGTTIVF